MGNLLFIDSDDIITLSDALRAALERRGVVFTSGGTYGHLNTDDDEEPDIDPYLGVIPKRHHQTPSQYGGCSGWADEANYGGCGGSGSNRCASCGTTSHYGGCGGGCGGHVSHRYGCGSGGC